MRVRLKPQGAERRRWDAGLGGPRVGLCHRFLGVLRLGLSASLRILVDEVAVTVNVIPGTIFCWEHELGGTR